MKRKEKITKVREKKRGQQGPLETKKGKCEKGGITIMDQPINLPSQFISLRCRGVEIQIFLSRSPEIMRNVQSFIPPVFPCFRRLSRITPSVILSIDPCKTKHSNQSQ